MDPVEKSPPRSRNGSPSEFPRPSGSGFGRSSRSGCRRPSSTGFAIPSGTAFESQTGYGLRNRSTSRLGSPSGPSFDHLPECSRDMGLNNQVKRMRRKAQRPNTDSRMRPCPRSPVFRGVLLARCARWVQEGGMTPRYCEDNTAELRTFCSPDNWESERSEEDLESCDRSDVSTGVAIGSRTCITASGSEQYSTCSDLSQRLLGMSMTESCTSVDASDLEDN